MFYKSEDTGFKELVDQVYMKTLAHGDRTSLSLFKIKKDAVIPSHSHPHEQTGYLVSGKMVFTIGDARQIAESGDSWSIPGDVEHDVHALEDCLVVEVFSPVREDYLP